MRARGGLQNTRPGAPLTGRRAECDAIDELLDAIRAGESRALVVHGEGGVGKTVLLDHISERAQGCRVARASGVQSEMPLAFAGLHQLCAPMLDRLDALPLPQRAALATAFGHTPGPPPDRFLIGLAVLSLLSHLAEERPLLCLVDDEQWLDHPSGQALAFVARRLGTEAVGIVFATRVPGEDLAGLSDMLLPGLSYPDASALLDSVLSRPIDRRIRDQIVAETRGNPLALVELPRGLTEAELAGGFGLPGAIALESSIEESFRRRVEALPDQTRQLLLLAAADPTGDVSLLWRAASHLDLGADAAAPAVDTGLVEFDTRVRFRHPLARSAAYRSASTRSRQQAHLALAEVTDQQLNPDRRAWHRAQAAPGPDEDVAAELERCADRARVRGGLGAAAAFLKHAATLTLDPARRVERALAAAQMKIQAGVFDVALELLQMAEIGPLDEPRRAQVEMVRAQLAYVTRSHDASTLLLRAAKRLEPVDPELARTAHLDALSAAIFAGRAAGTGGGVRDVARAALTARPAQPPRVLDLLLEGLAREYNFGYAAAVPVLREALTEFGVGMTVDDELRWLWLACVAAMRLWDDERWAALSARHLQLARETGTLRDLPLALTSRSTMLLFTGDLVAAASLADEARTVQEATGINLAPYGALGLAALRGDEADTAALIAATFDEVSGREQGSVITFAEYATALLSNGLGHYETALVNARSAVEDPASSIWPWAELVEAAVRTDTLDTARSSFQQLADMTTASGTDWALGLRARSGALLSEGEEAERLYREAIDRLSRTHIRTDLARAHLVYGEWLRRQRRRGEARDELRVAHTVLEEIGMAAFAERAWRELQATGESARKRTQASNRVELTAQEAQIARLARDGLSNPEIGTRLFISAHTVQYHLRKVFNKLGITSRSQLTSVLPADRAIGSRR